MTNVKTAYRKNFYNQHVIESTVLISDTKQLTLYTSKGSSGKLISNASVSTVNKDGLSVTHTMFVDFNKRYKVSIPKRTTIKVVEAQHNSINIEEVINDAKRFYKLG